MSHAVLGLNANYADSSACLLVDGRLVAAAEEERFRRVKRWAGFPEHAISYCLDAVGASVGDLDCLAFNRDRRANLARKARNTLTRRPSPLMLSTSLNESERIVCTPQEALDCLLRTRNDALVLAPFLLSRASGAPDRSANP